MHQHLLLFIRYFTHSKLPPLLLIKPFATQLRYKYTKKPLPPLTPKDQERENYWEAVMTYLDPKDAPIPEKRAGNLKIEPSGGRAKVHSSSKKKIRSKSRPSYDFEIDIEPMDSYSSVIAQSSNLIGRKSRGKSINRTYNKVLSGAYLSMDEPSGDFTDGSDKKPRDNTLSIQEIRTEEISTEPKDLHTGTNDVQTGTIDLQTGTKDIQAGTTDVQTGAIDLQTGTKDLQTGTTDVQTGTKDIQTGTTDAQIETIDVQTGTEIPEDLITEDVEDHQTNPLQPEPNFLEVLRESNWMKMGDPRKKKFRGIVINQIGNQVYVDYGYKFFGVFKVPDKMEPSQFKTGTKLLIVVKELELTQHFLGEDSLFSLLESEIEFDSIIIE